jgi:hypothetical protein
MKKPDSEEPTINPKPAIYPGQYWTPEDGQLCAPVDSL